MLKTMSKRRYYIVRSNKRERTITIRQDYEKSNSHVLYRSYRLSKEEFDYYVNYSTENDIKEFLKSNDYYVLL